MASAIGYLEDEQEAKDVVQELFIDLWHKKLYMGINSSLKNFLYAACRNRCLNVLKKRQQTQARLQDLRRPVTEEATVLNRLEKKEASRQLGQVVSRLPPRSAEVLTLTYYEGKSRREVAEIMNISPFTVKHQLARAIRLMSVLLNKTGNK